MIDTSVVDFETIRYKLSDLEKNIHIQKIIKYNQICQELEGYWFQALCKSPEIYGAFFKGENEITENLDGYINLFIANHIIDFEEFHAILREIITFVNEKDNVDILHIQLFFSNKKNYYEMIEQRQEEFKLLSIVVNKEIGLVERKELSENILIRKAQPRDEKEIINYLIKSYIDGTPENHYKQIGVQKFKKNISSYYSPLLKETIISLVMEKNKVFCGHVTYSIDSQDFYSIQNQASLVDLYITEDAKEPGIYTSLKNFGELACKEKGIQNIVGTITVGTKIHKAISVLSNLETENWNFESLIYIKD
ncbi:hypothetical protein [Priestia koreensis]|uniref:hypothetical protein n=1 Tax=Priestia koreensis TaxID=284581 RepID=UPI00203BB85E|nr:hypothetical protein [Priestia koreensis]MCM3005858.1 hypothetical protein [Priestia koreensis]